MSYLTDGLRARAARLTQPDADLMTAAASAIDHMTLDLARRSGGSEATVALSHGLGAPGGDETAQTGMSRSEGGSGALAGSAGLECAGCAARGWV